MGLFGPDLGGRDDAEPNTLRHNAERRRKKLEKQEKRVKRLSAPMLPRMVRYFRALTVFLTVGMIISEYSSCRTAAAYGEQVNYLSRISFTAFAVWTVFGGVWFLSSVGVLHTIKTGSAEPGEAEKSRSYKRGAAIAVAVWCALLAFFVAVRV